MGTKCPVCRVQETESGFSSSFICLSTIQYHQLNQYSCGNLGLGSDLNLIQTFNGFMPCILLHNNIAMFIISSNFSTKSNLKVKFKILKHFFIGLQTHIFVLYVYWHVHFALIKQENTHYLIHKVVYKYRRNHTVVLY